MFILLAFRKLVAKVLVGSLIKWAAALAGRAFVEKWDARTHAIKSREWFWEHKAKPWKAKIDSTPNKADDKAYVYMYSLLMLGATDPDGEIRNQLTAAIMNLYAVYEPSVDVKQALDRLLKVADSLGVPRPVVRKT